MIKVSSWVFPLCPLADQFPAWAAMPQHVSMDIDRRSDGLTQRQKPLVLFFLCSRSEGSRMSGVRYHVVVAFGVGCDGALKPIMEEAAANPQEAVLLARRLAKTHAGAVAFSRTMDIGRGRYGPANVHVVEGLIPSELAPICGQLPASRRLSGYKDSDRTIPQPQNRTNPFSVVVRPARWRR